MLGLVSSAVPTIVLTNRRESDTAIVERIAGVVVSQPGNATAPGSQGKNTTVAPLSVPTPVLGSDTAEGALRRKSPSGLSLPPAEAYRLPLSIYHPPLGHPATVTSQAAQVYPAPVVRRSAFTPQGPSNDEVTASYTAAPAQRLKSAAEDVLSRLSPADKGKSQAVRAAINAEDPAAQMAYDTLLASGKLTAGARDKSGRLLLDALDDVRKRHGLPPYILGDVIQELADPVSIGQEGQETCAPATAQMYLARENPVDYARIMGDLVTRGQVDLMNGTTVKMAPGLLPVPSKSANADYRTDSSVAFQDSMAWYYSYSGQTTLDVNAQLAMMRDLTNLQWEGTTDAHLVHQMLEKRNDLQALPEVKAYQKAYHAAKLSDRVLANAIASGLEPSKIEELWADGERKWATLDPLVKVMRQKHLPAVADELVRVVDQALQSGVTSVPIGFLAQQEGQLGRHASLITGVRVTPTGKKAFIVTNPWREEQILSEDNLRRVIHRVSVPKPLQAGT